MKKSRRIEVGTDPLSTMRRVQGAGSAFRTTENRFQNIHYNKKSGRSLYVY